METILELDLLTILFSIAYVESQKISVKLLNMEHGIRKWQPYSKSCLRGNHKWTHNTILEGYMPTITSTWWSWGVLDLEAFIRAQHYTTVVYFWKPSPRSTLWRVWKMMEDWDDHPWMTTWPIVAQEFQSCQFQLTNDKIKFTRHINLRECLHSKRLIH